MIREHESNTLWWGKPVGLVTDPAFFLQPQDVQSKQLNAFDWVEFKSSVCSPLPLQAYHQTGFFQVDTQIQFKIGLRRIQSTSSLDAFTVEFADEQPFSLAVEDVATFAHERFTVLPGMTEERLNARYTHWANQMIQQSPSWCLRILLDGECQGWFLSEETEKGLRLTLAMSHAQAQSSGLYLYQKAMLAFAQRGARIGWASFSVGNTPVLNIYSRLGARFVDSTGYWLWIKPSS